MKRSLHRLNRSHPELFLVVLLLFTAPLLACQVPVFRYALERWPADDYEIVILHDESLSESDQARLESLQELGYSSSAVANLGVRFVDIGEVDEDIFVDLWEQHQNGSRALMVVHYPRAAREVPDRVAFVSPFTDDAVAQLVDSPVRRKVAEHLLDGDSAVWIFVPSGKAEEDNVALKTLTEQAKLNAEELELPPQEEIEADEAFRAETDIELRIGFSVVTLNRDDPKEQFLLECLMGSESDLADLDHPMAFPVFGRGRCLYALVGKGIASDTIAMASQFIIGPCSCQVKNQNPGFDLLMSLDWDKQIGGSELSDPLPTIPSKPVLIQIPPGKSGR